MKYGYLISRTQAPLEWTLHPWIDSNCNSLTDEDQLHVVQFPDLHSGRLVSSAKIPKMSQLPCSPRSTLTASDVRKKTCVLSMHLQCSLETEEQLPME
jgi:hypothetical protein